MQISKLFKFSFKHFSIFSGITLTTLAGGAFLRSRFSQPLTSTELFKQAQHNVLSSQIKNTKYQITPIQINDKHVINTFQTVEYSAENKPPLVLIHGWGSGLGLWATNIDELSNHYTIYAIDLLGFGMSSRPKFKGKTPEDAKQFWIDSIEQWRNEMKLDKFYLLGHSLGGFLAAVYALEYPQHVDKLILAAPVGIAPWKIELNTLFKRFIGFLVWDLEVTPQRILRALGPYGKKLFEKMKNNNWYKGLEPGWDYLYHNSVSPSSGDVAFFKLMTREGWSYPLYEKLEHLKMPLRVIYGEKDYVRHEFGQQILNKVKVPADIVVIPNVGHHFYWQTSKQFNTAVAEVKQKKWL